MSSWILCKCGERIQDGAFPNPYVSRVFSERSYDELDDPINRARLASLFLKSDVIIQCPACGLLILKRTGAGELEFYRREGTN